MIFFIAELFVLGVVAVYYYLRPRLPLVRNHLYRNVVALEVIVLLSDALGAYVLDYHIDCYWLSYGFNMIYFGSFFLRAVAFFLLSMRIMGINYQNSRYKRMVLDVSMLILILITLSTPYTKWIFYIQNRQYFRGKLYWLTYGQFIFYLIAILILGIRNWGKVDNKTRRVVPVIWTILACGYAARYFFSHLLIANIFYMVVIIIVLFTYSDPESFVDSQTGLYNEHGFAEMMDERIRHQEYRILSIVIRNRELVHKVYTQSDYNSVMKAIGKYLKKVAPKDVVFLLNDGQFVILLDKKTSSYKLKTQIMERFTESWQGQDNALYLNAGIVEIDSSLPLNTTDEILQNLFTAGSQVNKANGPAILGVEKIRRQILVRAALERALKEDGVRLFLHPIIASDTWQVVGAEALARLYDEQLGVISPAEFISFAEENGSIIEIGEQIFTKTCEFLAQNRNYEKVGWINVNLSPIQCLNRDLPNQFCKILESYDVPMSSIHLEITEEAFVDADILGNRIEELRNKGFKIALDDFGIGYGNLTRLVSLPIDSVKLDRSLILNHFKKDDSVLTSVISILKEQGYKLAAEGVEEDYMVEILEQMGCDYIQGYCFSKPIPSKEFEDTYLY